MDIILVLFYIEKERKKESGGDWIPFDSKARTHDIQRYINDTLILEIYYTSHHGPSDRNSRDKFLKVGYHKKNHKNRPVATQMVCLEESLKRSCV